MIMTSSTKKRPSFSGGWIVPDRGSGQDQGMKAEGAKNPRRLNSHCHSLPSLPKSFHLNLTTFNCRTLSGEDKLQELQQELENIKWDILGLSEVRRKGEDLIELKNGDVFYHRGTVNGRTGGVGFLINKRLKENILEIESSSDRAARIVIQINKRYKLQIVQVYAPTSSHSDEEIEEFYQEIGKLHDKGKCHVKVIMGDFNAKIGKQQPGDNAVGKWGFGGRNERGDRLVEFAESTNLCLVNSFFKKKPGRKWTWKGPNGIKNEIDYVLVNKKYLVEDCTVLNRFKTGSDHRLVRCRLKFSAKLERQRLLKEPRTTVNIEALNDNKDKFQLELQNRFSVLSEEEIESKIIDVLKQSAQEIGGILKLKADKKLSEKTKMLMKKRKEMKTANNPMEMVHFAELNKTLRKCIKEDVRKFNYELIERTIENNKSYKKMKQRLSIGKKHFLAVKLEDGSITYNRKLILKRVEEYYTELYEESSLKEDRTEESSLPLEEAPEILPDEVRHAIKSMKNGKSAGPDGITAEIFKATGPYMDKLLSKVFTRCLRNNNIPKAWNHANIILIHKKGSKEDLNNYRPISLLPTIYKLFTKIITARIQNQLDSVQPREQAGFRSGYNTMDHIQVVREVISRANEYEIPLCMCFVDYEKAFDSVRTDAVIKALENQGINKAYIRIIKEIYMNATSSIQIHEETGAFKLGKGVRQGDTMSPKLFTATLEEVFKTLDWSNEGLKINGEYLSHLRFADDIVLFASDPQDLHRRIEDLEVAGRRAGLKMNLSKTKVLFNSFVNPQKIEINGSELEKVTKYVYLGQLITTDGLIMEEINRRIKLGWSAFGRNAYILKSTIPMYLRRKLFDQCILPVLTYGCETWTLNAKITQRLKTTQRSMERCMLGITRRERKRNTWVRQKTGVSDIIKRVRQLKWQWAGHIARRNDQRWTSNVMEWIPRNIKRPRRRPKDRWDRDIVKFLGATWRREARDRASWKNHGEAFIRQWIEKG